jgi:sugar O-acyltransferase (sialic acid O-acetyltransferase NeuD family)
MKQASEDIFLIGASGHAKVVLEVIESMGSTVTALVDKTSSNQFLKNIPIIGERDFKSNGNVIIAIGNNSTRKQLSKNNWHYTKAKHSSALVSDTVVVGNGTVIMHGAIIQIDSKIGEHVIVNTRAQIDHDCTVRDFAHIGPGAVLCGNVSVGEGTLIGAGSVILPGKKIGRWAVIGAGSVVTKDIEDYSVAVGNPAHIVQILK